MADEFDTNEGLTRREALKKGAMLGGALVWAVPVVQTVGMSAAMAREPSEGECCLRIVKLEAAKANVRDTNVDLTLKNCGEFVITDVSYQIDREVNGTNVWVNRFNDNIDSLNSGQVVTLGEQGFNLANNTYRWRVTAQFTCQSVDYPQQTQPAATYEFSNVVTIP